MNKDNIKQKSDICKSIPNNENLSICSSCKDSCCKRMGCEYAPEDIGEITTKNILDFLKSGYVSIDWWEGDVLGKEREITYFLRARNINSPIIDGSWGGICKLLTNIGCSLSWEKRPFGGRAIIPSRDFHCWGIYGKEEAAIDWYHYQNILDEVVNILNENNGGAT